MLTLSSQSKIRIDKFLWCVRIFKSRTLASNACNGGKVKIGGERIKPSHNVNIGDVFTVQQGYIKKTFKVIDLINKRISAKLAVNYIEDITPEEEKQKAVTARFASYQSKFKGIGRPTKKDRRLMEKFKRKL